MELGKRDTRGRSAANLAVLVQIGSEYSEFSNYKESSIQAPRNRQQGKVSNELRAKLSAY